MAFIRALPNFVHTTSSRGAVCAPRRPALVSHSRRVAATPLRTASMSATEVEVGSAAIDFTLPADGNRTVSLGQLSAENKTLIFYFYPRDATPGCTTEAKDFRDYVPKLKAVGAQVVGVSRDSVESHDKFVRELCLTFPLIADDGTLTEGYGVWKLKVKPGKSAMGIERSTFIVQDGVVVKVWRGVKAAGHAEEVFNAVLAL